MNTKYTTGDQVLIPAVIGMAKEQNGKITYTVETPWDIDESDIQPLPDTAVRNSLKRMISEMGL